MNSEAMFIICPTHTDVQWEALQVHIVSLYKKNVIFYRKSHENQVLQVTQSISGSPRVMHAYYT